MAAEAAVKGEEVEMSVYDYQVGLRLAKYPFYALVQAAMRKADSGNLERLQDAFPETWRELQTLYNTPGVLEE